MAPESRPQPLNISRKNLAPRRDERGVRGGVVSGGRGFARGVAGCVRPAARDGAELDVDRLAKGPSIFTGSM
eukprot:10909890-Heterocapsa_arctica.AAC.1